ncbi:ketopantoate reductase family protein [Halococcus saccharolyticus]|uniref:2-dehydropantoate 2-reductase n=1 Tax=Halococcus saccharolyticus DSM 5350 TaxID=1227455 RepID=M0MED1_9EURY|nr:ketopantoate reductase family protein [Halococcus saccharolyticus]EMA42775.1 2-dehydropantoate 2-reductase [Halococcus saccharolyticus DSM 5350]
MEIVVFGAGSLGSLVGGLCAREHHVTLVGRDPHIQAVRDSGLHVGGAFDFTVRPAARTDPPPSADLALVTVKAFDTDDAARALVDCDLDAVCSLQNGLGNEERLATRLDGVLAGTCTYGARLVEPGRVECTGIGEIALGAPDGGRSACAERVGRALRRAGVETTVADDMPRRLWKKLAVNAGINPTTALARVENGALADEPLHGIAGDAARETARVAREQGVDLGDDEAVAALDAVVEATAANTSSMLQDVRAGRRTEIDAINGAVVDRADAPVPVNRTLAGLVRAWEAGDQ